MSSDLNRIPAMFDPIKNQPLYDFSKAEDGDFVCEVVISGGFGTDKKPGEMGFDGGAFFKGLSWTIEAYRLTLTRCLKRRIEASDEKGNVRFFDRAKTASLQSREIYWGPERCYTLYIKDSSSLRAAVSEARNACSVLSNIRERLTAGTAKRLMDSDADALWKLLRALPKTNDEGGGNE